MHLIESIWNLYGIKFYVTSMILYFNFERRFEFFNLRYFQSMYDNFIKRTKILIRYKIKLYVFYFYDSSK